MFAPDLAKHKLCDWEARFGLCDSDQLSEMNRLKLWYMCSWNSRSSLISGVVMLVLECGARLNVCFGCSPGVNL